MERLTPGPVEFLDSDAHRRPKVELKGRFDHTASRLSRAIEGIKELYPDDNQPIFYRTDPDVHRLISHQTLNVILFVARSREVIPIFFHSGRWTFYPRGEVVRALSYTLRQVQRGVSIKSLVEELKEELTENPRLNIREAASALGLQPRQFQRLVVDGVIPFGKKTLVESIRRVRDPSGYMQPLIDPVALENQKVKSFSKEWRRHNLENLTKGKFAAHRKLYATVSEVARIVDVHPDVTKGEVKTLAEILIDGGVQVTKVDHVSKGRLVGSYWVLLAQEKERAGEILRQNPVAFSMGREGVEQICGPRLDLVPSRARLRQDRVKYIVVGSFLRSCGVKVGYGTSLTVEDFLGDDCPVVIIKYTESQGKQRIYTGYICPVEQKEELRDYALSRLAEAT